jgi:hypothetical protein
MIVFKFKIKEEKLDLLEGHRSLMAFLEALSPSFKNETWFRLPHSQEESEQPRIPCLDTDRFLRQTARDMGDSAERAGTAANDYGVLITTAASQEAWERPGRTFMDYSPCEGLVRIETFSPPGSASQIYELARERFLIASSHLDVVFANCDFPRPPRPNHPNLDLYYGDDLQVFAHREFLGWMGFVKRNITNQEIPEADEVIPLPEKGGTMIVAVADAFDVHNRTHVEQAQRVEMRLVDLDALPVTDPRFLE